MTTTEIARKLASLGQREDALKAYAISLHNGSSDPAAQLEAAVYILQAGGDYRISYTCFLDLYKRGFYREEILPLMDKVFYEPNIKLLKGRYERNCKMLSKYPYLFRADFLPFDQLPIRFYPYDDHSGYVPFLVDQASFGGFVNVKDPIVSRNFFKDLENPILVSDIFSQYELEYLNDNVRKSEYVARENHIYLHYTDWGTFCAWLQVLNMRPLLKERKIVFLIENEIEQYPMDFKQRYGIDYSRFPVKPVGISEVNRLIWHTQLSTHNGGDLFNEIFDAHPNLLAIPSVMFYDVEKSIKTLREALGKVNSLQEAMEGFGNWTDPRLIEELFHMRDPSDKDLLVAIYLSMKDWNECVDPASRITPAIFFQPHFHNIVYQLRAAPSGNTVLEAQNVEQIHNAAFMKEFKYIKTFTPMRRFTTSHGATVKFMYDSACEKKEETGETKTVVSDAISERVFNRSFMIDPEDRLYHDSILVRFEDAKLNPKATFTALAAFLDLPYTESMEYCTEMGKLFRWKNGVDTGFSLDAVYRTYDNYINDSERYFIEYFLRDAYAFYGYDFHCYDGAPVDEEKVEELIQGFTQINKYMRMTWIKVFRDSEVSQNGQRVDLETEVKVQDHFLDNYMRDFDTNRLANAKILLEGLRFVNKNGQPLRMMPLLKLDRAMLEKPLYH